ncbi:MAG: hypothetical protein CMH49_02520 [Myxococcales bacterium]|nr:hypothetical protein [Myxococcales bacterium]
MSKLLNSFIIFAVCSLSFTACFLPQDQGDDFEPPPPPAAAQFIHQNPEMGSVEILFDGGLLTTVSFGDVSAAVSLPQGDGAFAFRYAGAPSTFYESELYSLEARVYTFALVSDAFADNNILDLSEASPAPEEDQHWVRLINLSDVQEGRIFRGRDELVNLPLDDNPSAYIAVESAASTSISLSDANGAPIAIEDGIQLPSGGSSLLVISGSDADDSVRVNAVTLNIERLSLVEPGLATDPEEQ